MPWCPICKNEYREGISECADCKVPLVESLDNIVEDADALLFSTENAALAESLLHTLIIQIYIHMMLSMMKKMI